MLSRRYRLCRKADFARLRRHSRRFAHPLVVLIVCKHETADGRSSLSSNRFAFSASKRVGNAVQRNRAKRVMREAIRTHLHDIQPHWDCLLVARSQTPQATFAEVEKAVLSVLGQAKLL